jgi:hypothetical protein
MITNITMRNIDNRYSHRNSSGNYTSLIVIILLVLFFGAAIFTKPDKLSVENEIVDRLMLTQPNLVKVFKNLLFGEEMNEHYTQNFIKNTLRKNGYKNIGIYDEDYVILRKIEFRNEDSGESLITGYGMFDYTKVVIDYTKGNLNENDTSDEGNSLGYGKPSYKRKENEPHNHYENTSYNYENYPYKKSFDKKVLVPIEKEEESAISRLIKNRDNSDDSHNYKKKNEPKEDSIKI